MESIPIKINKTTQEYNNILYEFIEIDNGNNLIVTLCNLGAQIFSIKHKDKNSGKYEEITLNQKEIKQMLNQQINPNFGKTCGRTSGRISNASFKIKDIQYKLFANNNHNNLHGGQQGFAHKVWQTEITKQDKQISILFNTTSEDMEEGFPGKLQVKAEYIVCQEDIIKINYDALVMDEKVTHVNMTNHTYWNLSGDFKESTIKEHKLELESNSYCVLDKWLCPTGEIRSVKEQKEFDFNKGADTNILGDIGRLDGKIDGGGENGIDHPFVISQNGECLMKKVGSLSSKSRRIEIHSNQPAIVIYTSNFLPKNSSSIYQQHAAVCLETQSLPNAINMHHLSNWPPLSSLIFDSQNPYSHTIQYHFYHIS